jgi:hypothetical protein
VGSPSVTAVASFTVAVIAVVASADITPAGAVKIIANDEKVRNDWGKNLNQHEMRRTPRLKQAIPSCATSASHPRTLPVVEAAAAVSFKETRISLAEFKLTGKVKVWQTSYIQKYRDNYCEGNHEMSSDRDVKSEMTVEENRNLAWPLKNKYGMSCACKIQ